MNWRKIIRGIVAGILLLSLFYLLFRNYALETVIKRIAEKIDARYRLELVVEHASFSGLHTIELTGISMVPENGDTLFHLDSLSATPSFASLLAFNLRVQTLKMKNGSIHLNCKGDDCNYAMLLSKGGGAEQEQALEKNFATLFNRIFSRSFDFAPQNAEIKNLDLSFVTDTFETEVRIPEFRSSKEEMAGELVDTRQQCRWKLTGTFDQDSRKFDAVIIPLQNYSRLPLLKELFNITSRFDTLHIAIAGGRYANREFNMKGEFAVSGLSLHHNKISSDTVIIESSRFDYSLNATSNSVCLDSSSIAVLNKISIHPYLKFTDSKSKAYEFSIATDTVQSTDFFSSLPPGVFDETRDIRAEGRLYYRLRFRLDSSIPDSLQFDSQMGKINFRLLSPGKENLYKLNDEFVHTVYEYGRPYRSFAVGPSNPDYSSLDQVSLHLKNAILTAEDGSFFFHNGFNAEAFRKSIAENFRKRKFVRGGSTISMQLVKNVFLSRRKTVARKAEEALMVWLIESNRLCSKERMFEVYLNIIELGPGVYGVGEASRFYFNKRASELNLSESIFLASLLPHPKWFRYSFDASGNLKPYLADYYRVVTNFLLRKNLITQEEFDQVVPNVVLTGIARELVIPTDSIPAEEEE